MDRRHFLAASSGLVLTGTTAIARQAAGNDETAVRQVIQRYVDARTARDARDIEPLLTPDADQLVSDGTWRRGRDELVAVEREVGEHAAPQGAATPRFGSRRR